jgi:serine/threonine-protein kinase
MGSVYRAWDTELDEAVALKLLRREILDAPGALVRFRQEVKLARRVTHRNVARTFDIGEHEGQYFLTMELVAGESLAALLRRRSALPVGEAVEIAVQLCDALAAAHAAGVVHRDLKPDNVLVASSERVVITDFGVASTHLGEVSEHGSAVTSERDGPVSGETSGTPAYMAPEQVEGLPGLDHRVDIYALGEVIYEMLTGEPVWPASLGYSLVTARLNLPPPDPRSRQGDIPDTLAEIVLACLARRREDRPRDAAAVAEVLAPWRGVATASRPATPPADLPSPDDRAVAVLRFKNLGAPEDEVLAAGLTEDLLDTLAMTRGLKVKAHPASQGGDPCAIGRALGVHVVVDGSVRRIAGQIRINARLVSVADGFHLWAERFDRPLTELIAVNDETVRAIAGALSAKHLGPDREAPSDPVTMELYLRAMSHPTTAADQGQAELFEQALLRAPRDPVILSACAVFLARRSFTGGASALIDLARASQVAERAVEAAPHLAEPWVARAHSRFSADDPVAAASAVRRALRAGPSLAGAHELAGRILLEVGLLAEGIAHLERAHWLDPSVKATLIDLLRGHQLVGADSRVARILRAIQADASPHMLTTLGFVRAMLWKGERLQGKAPRPQEGHPVAFESLDTMLRVLAAGAFSAEDAARNDAMIVATPPGSRSRRLFVQLKIEQLAFAGEIDAAEEALPDAVEAGLLDVAWMDRCPLLARLRERPAFGAMRERVALRASPVVAAWRSA